MTTLSQGTDRQPSLAPERRRRRFTPLEAMFLALPLLYVFGLAGFMWALIGPFCLLVLHDRHDTRLPFGSAVLAVMVGWALIASVPLITEGMGPALLGVYRWLVLLSTLGLFLFVANQLDREAARRLTSIAMLSVWASLIGFGLVSFVLPDFSFPTPARLFLPNAFMSNSYLADLTRFQLAEIQTVLGEVSARPSAPFAYANGWGSAYVLSTPFAYLWLVHHRSGAARIAGAAVFAVGTIVAIASLNRAVWALLVLSALYGVLQSNQRIRNTALLIPAGLAGLWFALSFTPVGGLVASRLEVADESNRTRTDVVSQSIDAARDAPFFGYGAPIDGFGDVPIGTHGFTWFLMISYGIVALVLFVGWLAGVTAASARLTSPEGKAAHLVLLVTLLQLPVYGLLPQLPLVGLAAALAYHCRGDRTPGTV